MSPRALVVGLGRMGGFHRKVLRDLGLDVTTVDPDPRAGADYTSIPHQRFDVVCIATPIEQLAEEAARWAGHEGWLLVEKPAASSLGEAHELAQRLAGQRTAVGYVERFNPCVAALKRALDDSPPAVHARFRRWNDRPSPDLALDLMSHDVDLAAFLGWSCPVQFDARAEQRACERTIRVRTTHGLVGTDLTAHSTSPLHAQWHAFLSGREGCATLDDATRVLAALTRQRDGVAACA